MGTNIFRGDAPAVAQVNTVTPASVTIGNTFSLVINTKTITVTATAATVANVTALLAAAVAASTIPEFQEVTAADITTALTLTANTAGVPFTQTSSSATGGGSGGHSLSTSTTTTSSGPNDWNVAANWSLGAVPVDTDDVYIDNTSVDILYGLSQSSIDLTSLNIGGGFTGRLGLPSINATGGYYEYRQRYLALTATTVNIGYGDGSGSGRILLDLGNHATTINVSGTGSAAEQGIPAVVLKGHASATYTLNITKGSVGAAIETGHVCVLGTVRIGNEGNPAGDVSVMLGAGCTTTTVEMSGGTLASYAAVGTVNMTSGTWSHYAGSVTAMNLDGGQVNYLSTGTVTTLNVGTDAAIDFSQDIRARTVTTTTMQASGKIVDTYKSVTWTNGIVLSRCSLDEVTLDLGSHITILVNSTPAAQLVGVYTGLIGDGVATSYTVAQATHGLAASNKLVVAVYFVSTGALETVNTVVNNGTGAVTVVFGVAPASNAYRIVIVGGAS